MAHDPLIREWMEPIAKQIVKALNEHYRAENPNASADDYVAKLKAYNKIEVCAGDGGGSFEIVIRDPSGPLPENVLARRRERRDRLAEYRFKQKIPKEA